MSENKSIRKNIILEESDFPQVTIETVKEKKKVYNVMIDNDITVKDIVKASEKIMVNDYPLSMPSVIKVVYEDSSATLTTITKFFKVLNYLLAKKGVSPVSANDFDILVERGKRKRKPKE